jgi:poly-gamma-glutamate synthesis protein (capsule biosynthesis protein)
VVTSLIIFCVLAFCGCAPSYDEIKINSSPEYPEETAFVEALLSESGLYEELKLKLSVEQDGQGPKIHIDFYSTMGNEKETDGGIPISRVALVPREEAHSFRAGTSLAACLEGKETTVPAEEITPPFVALRVDGLALGDAGYPLIREVGIRLRIEEGGNLKDKDRLVEKARALGDFLESADKPLILPIPKPFWIAVGGDVMLGRGATEILLREGPQGVFGKTAEMLASSDLSLLNLEGVVSTRGEKVSKTYNFRFDPAVALALRDAGVDAVLHANNHVYDYGGAAFLDSLSWLDKAGVGIIGAGLDDEAASDPFIFNWGDWSYRVFGIASFPRENSGWDGANAAALPGRPGMLQALSGGRGKLKEKIGKGGEQSFDIVFFHGGTEWSVKPDASTRELYTDLVKSGASLIIGTHPHIVQGFEWVLDKPVFWSLGNYVFAGMEDTGGGDEGLFFRLGVLDGRLLYLEPFALALNRARTEIAPVEKLETFYTRSKELR